jgi:hypothetical protein
MEAAVISNMLLVCVLFSYVVLSSFLLNKWQSFYYFKNIYMHKAVVEPAVCAEACETWTQRVRFLQSIWKLKLLLSLHLNTILSCLANSSKMSADAVSDGYDGPYVTCCMAMMGWGRLIICARGARGAKDFHLINMHALLSNLMMKLTWCWVVLALPRRAVIPLPSWARTKKLTWQLEVCYRPSSSQTMASTRAITAPNVEFSSISCCISTPLWISFFLL